MRSAETQTELLECSDEEEEQGASSEDAISVIDDDQLEGILTSRPLDSDERPSDDEGGIRKNDDEEEDDDEEDSLGEATKLKSIKRLHCGNLFNFNKLELLNERCSGGVSVVGGGQQQISDSSRNLCEHEVHVAIDDELSSAAGEGKRTMMAMGRTTTTMTVLGDDSGSSAVIFIQESPEVIL